MGGGCRGPPPRRPLRGPPAHVMSPQPGRIKREITITLPHPRSPDSHAVVDLAADIREELRNPEHLAEDPGTRWAI